MKLIKKSISEVTIEAPKMKIYQKSSQSSRVTIEVTLNISGYENGTSAESVAKPVIFVGVTCEVP